MNAVVRPGLSTGMLALLLGWPLLVLAAGGYLGSRYLDARLAESLRYRPPVLLIDEAEIVRATSGATAQERARIGIQRAQELAERARAQGFLVLQHHAVYAGGDELEIRTQ